MGSIEVGPIRVIKDMFMAFGLCRGIGYFLVGIVVLTIAFLFEFKVEAEKVERYVAYLSAALALSFTAYSITLSLTGTLDRLAEKANNGKSPLEELFAVFTCSILLHLLAMAVLIIFDGTGCAVVWYVFLGLLSVCLYSFGDIGLSFFTLHTFLKNQRG